MEALLIIISTTGFCLWIIIGMKSIIEIKEHKTYFSKYLNKTNIVGGWNLIFILTGPLVLLDIPYSKKLKQIEKNQRNQYIIDNSKFKVGDVITTKINNSIDVKAVIREIEFHNELKYYITIFLDNDRKLDWHMPIREKEIKQDRKSRIDKIYGN